MEFKTKYNVNDIVYVLVECVSTMTCPLCRGARHLVLVDGRKIKCPECRGDGRIPHIDQCRPAPMRIRSLSINVSSDTNISIGYAMDTEADPDGKWDAADDCFYVYDEDEVYPSFEEAQAAADRTANEVISDTEDMAGRFWVVPE